MGIKLIIEMTSSFTQDLNLILTTSKKFIHVLFKDQRLYLIIIYQLYLSFWYLLDISNRDAFA
jgi:hypothetical protein